MKPYKYLLVLILAIISVAFYVGDDKTKIKKISTNDHYNFIAVNNCKMYISNNGDGSHDPITGGNGFFFPYQTTPEKGLIFEDGLIFGGKIGNEIRVNGNTHRQGLQAGKILQDGVADDPALEKYRVYKIRKDWREYPHGAERDQLEKDWNEWPVEDGAPWIDLDEDGIFSKGIDEPQCIGDETLWYVANDMDPIRSTFTYGTLPMGLEFQTTVYAFSNPYSPLNDMVFKKYKVIHKGNKIIKDFYFGYWSDVDLGDAGDDLVGCDTTLSLAYSYNGDNFDAIYKDGAPPVAGYALLQGPIVNGASTDSAYFNNNWIKGKKNLPMTAFTALLKHYPLLRDARQGDALGGMEFYNYMKGLYINGSPIINPISGVPTTYCVPGDPVTQSGWYDYKGWPGVLYPPADRRQLLTTGPFNFAPGDTQEVVYAIVAARGNDHLNSIKRLRESVSFVRNVYTKNIQLNYNIPSTTFYSRAMEREINLFWFDEAENFKILDEALNDTLHFNSAIGDTSFATPDKYFRFQGYQLFQYKDEKGTDPILVDQWDLKDSVQIVFHWQDKLLNNPASLSNPVLKLSDGGIERKTTITKDMYTEQMLIPAKTYYYGLRTIAYSKFSSPPIEFSEPKIIPIIPGKSAIDFTPIYSVDDEINAIQTTGFADAEFKAVIFAPEFTLNKNYKIGFSANGGKYLYHLINSDNNDTLYTHPVYENQSDVKVIDGFYPRLINIGKDSLKNAGSLVKSVLEIKGKNGIDVTPKNVLREFNTSGKWKILTAETLYITNPFYQLNWMGAAGYYDYEIRFTSTGSQFYYSRVTGTNPHLRNDSISPNRLPFEVWRIDALGNQKQALVKIGDANINTQWDFDSVKKQSENIMIYFMNENHVYSEPLPNTSGVLSNAQHRLKFFFSGEIPEEGTVIKISTWKPVMIGTEFSFSTKAPNKNDIQSAKERISQINVFPNPYFGRESFDDRNEFVTFTNLPTEVTIRIFSLAGTFITKLEKDNNYQYLRWDLKNQDGYYVGSGIYLAYLDMPNIGTKIMKIAIVQENRFYLGY